MRMHGLLVLAFLTLLSPNVSADTSVPAPYATIAPGEVRGFDPQPDPPAVPALERTAPSPRDPANGRMVSPQPSPPGELIAPGSAAAPVQSTR